MVIILSRSDQVTMEHPTPADSTQKSTSPDVPGAGSPPQSKATSSRFFSVNHLRFMSLVQGFCGVVFGVDVLLETLVALQHGAVFAEVAHILLELIASGLLAYSTFLTIRQLQALRLEVAQSKRQLTLLRTEFDNVIQGRFKAWHLSHSESDVALLTIKGLSIHDIAETRHTREGTIKAQLSMIFRKAGVSSRTELLALFMDELLDFGASQERGTIRDVPPPPP
jgi:DNA-binding CsgD family transcriptional regulator